MSNARKAGVDGALIVQPGYHGYDHSYVLKAMTDYPNFFRRRAF